MKRCLTLFVHILLGIVCFAQGTAPDWADKKGAIGIGLEPTLAFISGTNFGFTDSEFKGRTVGANVLGRYWINNSIQAELGVGYAASHYAEDNDGFDYSVDISGINLVARGQLIPFKCESPIILGVLLGVDIFNGTYTWDNDALSDPESEDYSSFAFDAGLRFEWFTQQYLSIPASIHLNLSFLEVEDTKFDGEPDASGVNLNILGSDLWGQAGFTVWFN